MAFSSQTEDDDVLSEINITPLVDVMLVLLVAFIVTAPMLTNAVKVNLPKTASTPPPAEKKAVNLTVNSQGDVFLDKSQQPLDSLESELHNLQTNNPDLTIHLQADDEVKYGTVAKVITSIERAGVSKFSIITAKQ
jgi:biopolymer transport protein ExbD